MQEYNLIRDQDGNKMVIQPYAFGFQPIGDFSFMAEQNTSRINGQLDRIGSALSDGQLQDSVRTSVMADLTALNDSFRLAAGAETTGSFNIADIEDQLRQGDQY